MIVCRALRKEFQTRRGTVVALDDVDITFARGSVTGVVGPSGSGKSTLVRCLTALERPTSGSVVVDGEDLAALDDTRLREARRRVGMVFQHANLLANRTAADNVALPLEVAGVPRARRRARSRELLGLVGLAGREDAYPAQLSGGQKQRVGIARALANDPSVLLCDEPTSALDPTTTREVLGVITDVGQRLGLTVVVVTPEMSVLREVCDSVVVLADGRVVEQGRLDELVRHEGSTLAAELVPLPTPGTGRGPWVDVVTVGEEAAATVVSRLSRRLEADLALVAGGAQTIGGTHLSRVRLAPGDLDAHDVVTAARELGSRAEVVA